MGEQAKAPYLFCAPLNGPAVRRRRRQGAVLTALGMVAVVYQMGWLVGGPPLARGQSLLEYLVVPLAGAVAAAGWAWRAYAARIDETAEMELGLWRRELAQVGRCIDAILASPGRTYLVTREYHRIARFVARYQDWRRAQQMAGRD